MRLHKLLDNSLRILLMIAFGSTLVLSGCNINVRKRGEGQDKKVDIETPVGGLHIRKDADARDVGVPIYPGARRKEKDEGDNDNNASVNISSSLFSAMERSAAASLRCGSGKLSSSSSPTSASGRVRYCRATCDAPTLCATRYIHVRSEHR